ncbi:MAG: hypothetical protein ABR867_01530 [Nitrososphaerales archaeon]
MARLGRHPVAVARTTQPKSPTSPPTSYAELKRPTPRPDLPPLKSLATKTTAGAKTRAIPAPTTNLSVAISGTDEDTEVPKTASDDRKTPSATTFLGPHLAARSPPGTCARPSPM